MRLLDRYLLRELLVPLVFCIAGFLILCFAFSLFTELDELLRLNLRAGDIAEYFLIKTPEFLPVLLPVSLLLALLYTLTNHARHHEITAIRAAGVSLWRLAAPYFAAGAAASVVLFALNELWIADIADRADRIKNRRVAAQNNPAQRHLEQQLSFKNSRDGREWYAATYNRRTTEMFATRVTRMMPDGSLRQIVAERAVRTNNVWVFFNAREYRYAANTNAPPVPVLQTNVLAMPEFTETPKLINMEIKMAGRLSLKNARSPDIPLVEIIPYLAVHPKLPRDLRFQLQTMLHGRLAMPWVCLVVVLIGLPFGAASGRRNVFVGVAGSVFLCFAYYFLMQVSLGLGTGGYFAPWIAAWLPNLIFGITGAWLTARAR
jgi:lipopolysaccharide export system permease protein